MGSWQGKKVLRAEGKGEKLAVGSGQLAVGSWQWAGFGVMSIQG